MNLPTQARRNESLIELRADRQHNLLRSLDDMAIEWLKVVARRRRPSTVENYRQRLILFTRWLRDKRHVRVVGGISPDDLRALAEHTRQMETGGRYKASTVNSYLNPVRLWLRWLIAEAAVFDRAPDSGEPWVTEARVNEWLADVKDTSRPTRKERALSADEVGQLLAAITDPRDRALFSLLAGAGLRVSECCALRAGDVQVRPDGAGIVHVIEGKGGRQREVVVHRGVVGHLYAWALLADLRLGDPTDARTLWPPRSGEGKALSRIRVYQLLQQYAKAAGIQRKLSPHNLRHTYGTERYRAERDPLAVANALGHAGLAYVTTYVKDVESSEAEPFAPKWESP